MGEVRTYLVRCNYGGRPVWYWMEGPSVQALRGAFPGFAVYESLPEWWAVRPAMPVGWYRLGEPMDGRLCAYKEESERAMPNKLRERRIYGR